MNIAAFDVLDLELGMLFLSSKVVANVCIETGMQNQLDSGVSSHVGGDWQVAGQFQQAAGSANSPPNPQWQKLNIASGVAGAGLLKFVRWRVDLSSAGTATFFIRGMARRWGR